MTLRNFSSTAAETTLSAGVDASVTTLTVSATTGFPAAPFILAVDAGAAAQELVLVTNVAGTTLTVTRAYDSTVASTHDTGAVVSHSHAALDFREANTHVNAESGVHGVTGDVVGTTDEQTLTDKTLVAPAATGSLAEFGGAWSAWAPTVTASTGAFTTVDGSGRYVQVGKTVHWSLTITITAAGTASAYILFTLPVTAVAATGFIGTGRARPSPIGTSMVFLASDTQARISKYDDTTVIATGNDVTLSGTYEAA